MFTSNKNMKYILLRILEIKNVYQHKDKTKTYSYVYELTDGTSTFYTKPYRITNSEGGKLFLDGTTYTKNTYVNTKPSVSSTALFVLSVSAPAPLYA